MSTIAEQTDLANSVEVTANGSLQIREATSILRNGVVDPTYAPVYRRYVLVPGDGLTGKDPRIVSVAQAVWTPAVIAAYQAAQAAAAAAQ